MACTRNGLIDPNTTAQMINRVMTKQLFPWNPLEEEDKEAKNFLANLKGALNQGSLSQWKESDETIESIHSKKPFVQPTKEFAEAIYKALCDYATDAQQSNPFSGVQNELNRRLWLMSVVNWKNEWSSKSNLFFVQPPEDRYARYSEGMNPNNANGEAENVGRPVFIADVWYVLNDYHLLNQIVAKDPENKKKAYSDAKDGIGDRENEAGLHAQYVVRQLFNSVERYLRPDNETVRESHGVGHFKIVGDALGLNAIDLTKPEAQWPLFLTDATTGTDLPIESDNFDEEFLYEAFVIKSQKLAARPPEEVAKSSLFSRLFKDREDTPILPNIIKEMQSVILKKHKKHVDKFVKQLALIQTIWYSPAQRPSSVLRKLLDRMKRGAVPENAFSKTTALLETIRQQARATIDELATTEHIMRDNIILYNCAKALAAGDQLEQAQADVEKRRLVENETSQARADELLALENRLFATNHPAISWLKVQGSSALVQLATSGALLDRIWDYSRSQYAEKRERDDAKQRAIDTDHQSTHDLNEEMRYAAKRALPAALCAIITELTATVQAHSAETAEYARQSTADIELATRCVAVITSCYGRIQEARAATDARFQATLAFANMNTPVLRPIVARLQALLQKKAFYKRVLIVTRERVSHNSRMSGQVTFQLNMLLMGEPGTGKSETAKGYAALLGDLHLVTGKANFHACSVADVHGQYVGQTATKTRHKINQSLDGVLFLDEAYAMVSTKGREINYGEEFNGVLVEQMARSSILFTVVAAGYESEMKTKFLASNAGYSRRFRTQLVSRPSFKDLMQATAVLLAEQCGDLDNSNKEAPDYNTKLQACTKKEMDKMEGLFNRIKSTEAYRAFARKQQASDRDTIDRMFFFPAYYSACQDIAALVIDEEETLPDTFVDLRNQEIAAKAKTVQPTLNLDAVIQKHKPLLAAKGMYGEEDLINWQLAEPLLQAEVNAS